MKVHIIVGARPQFIKLAPVLAAARPRGGVTAKVIHTGQHYSESMSDIFFEELDIPKPDYHLGIHAPTHGAMTGRMLEAVEQVLLEDRPDGFMVIGDTNSTLAGALAAVKLHIPLYHLEAGLRMYDLTIPEEVNRRVSDHLSVLNLCPTPLAVRQLKLEGLGSTAVHVGDVMYDTCLQSAERAKKSKVLEAAGVVPGEFVVLTMHRPDHVDTNEPLQTRLDYVREQAASRPIVFPVHPRTKGSIEKFGLDMSGFIQVEPLGYLDMTHLVANCHEVFTDSGGLQKEAYFLGKQCTILRTDKTEWMELIDAGWNRLMSDSGWKERHPVTDYGDGHASEKVWDAICK